MGQHNPLKQLGLRLLWAWVLLLSTTPLGWAQPVQIDMLMDADAVSDFTELLDESEAQVYRKVADTFAANSEIDRLRIQLLVNRSGTIVPLMTTEISRKDWARNQRIDTWTRYFSTAQVLLSYSVAIAAPESAADPPQPLPVVVPRTQEQIEAQDALD